MTVTKLVTCCYCGTRAALVLRGDSRHELTCSQCGAPLHRLKMLRTPSDRGTAPTVAPTRPGHRSAPQKNRSRPSKPSRKHRKRKGLLRKVLEEVWDEIEDIFD